MDTYLTTRRIREKNSHLATGLVVINIQVDEWVSNGGTPPSSFPICPATLPPQPPPPCWNDPSAPTSLRAVDVVENDIGG